MDETLPTWFWVNMAVGLTAIIAVASAGFYFKIRPAIIKGVSVLIVVIGMWNVLQHRREDLKERHGSEISSPMSGSSTQQ